MMLMVMETGRGVSIFYFSNFCKTNNYIFFLFISFSLHCHISNTVFSVFVWFSTRNKVSCGNRKYSFSEFVYIWEILVANSTLKSLSCRCSYKIWSPRYVLSILAINVEFYLSEGDFLFVSPMYSVLFPCFSWSLSKTESFIPPSENIVPIELCRNFKINVISCG